MHKFLFALVPIISHCTLFSQDINIPTENITKFLCKKWQIDYLAMNGMKIARGAGAPEINYEFNSDNTYSLLGHEPQTKSKGTWKYDENKKLIKLFFNGLSNTSVISLNENELVILVNTREATPDDPSDMKMFFKPITGSEHLSP